MIDFEINQNTGTKISEKDWSEWFLAIEKKLKLKKDLEVSVAIVDEKAIKKLNHAYRDKNYVTDVLSFGEMDSSVHRYFQDKNFLGEIVICYPQATKQAKKAKHSIKNEIQLLLTHGFLHLLGYDHEKSELEAKKMRKLEEKVMGKTMIS